MFTFSGTSTKTKLATAVVVAVGAIALPAVASAGPVANGCELAPCEFVGGTGANPDPNPANTAGGTTQFEIQPSGPAVVCTDSRATATTDGTNVVTTELTFEDCLAADLFSTEVTCESIDITIDSVSATGDAHGRLNLAFEACTIDVLDGGCVIKTSAEDPDGQDITLDAEGADAIGTGALLTVPVDDNTDALTFSASGFLCGLAGVPSSGTATFSDSPNTGLIVYEEVGSNLHIEDVT